jgi:hypothetical protein
VFHIQLFVEFRFLDVGEFDFLVEAILGGRIDCLLAPEVFAVYFDIFVVWC